MKKRISILLAVVLVLTMLLVACGEKKTDDDKKDNTKVENNDADVDADEDADADADVDVDEDADADEDEEAPIPSKDYAKLDERVVTKVRSGDTNVIFKTGEADDLQFDVGWSVRHYPIEGGVYVDGDLMTHIPFVKVAEDQYLFYWPEFGVTVTEGTEVTFDAVIGSQAYGVRIGPSTLTYDGSNWVGEGVEHTTE